MTIVVYTAAQWWVDTTYLITLIMYLMLTPVQPHSNAVVLNMYGTVLTRKISTQF